MIEVRANSLPRKKNIKTYSKYRMPHRSASRQVRTTLVREHRVTRSDNSVRKLRSFRKKVVLTFFRRREQLFVLGRPSQRDQQSVLLQGLIGAIAPRD